MACPWNVSPARCEDSRKVDGELELVEFWKGTILEKCHTRSTMPSTIIRSLDMGGSCMSLEESKPFHLNGHSWTEGEECLSGCTKGMSGNRTTSNTCSRLVNHTIPRHRSNAAGQGFQFTNAPWMAIPLWSMAESFGISGAAFDLGILLTVFTVLKGEWAHKSSKCRKLWTAELKIWRWNLQIGHRGTAASTSSRHQPHPNWDAFCHLWSVIHEALEGVTILLF